MTGEPCILVNRTKGRLHFVADSRHFWLEPGDNLGFNLAQAPFAQAQNPLMGSENYHSLEFQSLVGVKGQTDCTPLDQETLDIANLSVERFDRAEAGLAAVKTVKKPRQARGFDTSSGANSNAFAVASL